MLPTTAGVQLKGTMDVETIKGGKMGFVLAGLLHGTDKGPMEIQKGGIPPPLSPRLQPPRHYCKYHCRPKKRGGEVPAETPEVPGQITEDETVDTGGGDV